MSGTQHLGQCGDEFYSKLIAAIKSTTGFPSEQAAVSALSRKLQVGKPAIMKAMKEVGAVFVQARRKNKLPVHIHLLPQGAAMKGRAA